MCRKETANVLSKNLGEYLILLTDPAKIGILQKKVKLLVKKNKTNRNHSFPKFPNVIRPFLLNYLKLFAKLTAGD